MSVDRTHNISPGYFQCECPGMSEDPVCNGRQFFVGVFYDMNITHTESAAPLNQVKFALGLQKFLIDDPIDGDLKVGL